MKKIILILLIMCTNISLVSAKTDIYYSDYSKDRKCTNSIVDNSDLLNLEVERRYKWYLEVKQLGDYYIENKNPDTYPFIDKSDSKLSEYSNWQEETPDNVLNRQIDKRDVYYYQNMDKVRYIHLSSLVGGNNAFRIPELEIFVDGIKIDYDIYCEGCNSDFKTYISNGIFNENKSTIDNGGYLRIDLKDYYYASDIKLRMFLFDTSSISKTHVVSLTREPHLEDIYLSKSYSHDFSMKYLSEITYFDFNLGQLNKINPKWEQMAISLEPIASNNTRIVNKVSQYRYKDQSFRYYQITRDYLEGYHINYNGYIKDEDSYLDYYCYFTREKVEVEKDILITNKNQNLKDFINSTVDYEVITDFDNTKNGIYIAKIIFPFITLEKQITVDIKSNEIKDFENKIDDLNEKIRNLNIQIKQYEDLIKTSNSQSKNYINKIGELSNIIENKDKELLNYKTNLNKEVKVCSDNKKNNSEIEKDKIIETLRLENTNLSNQLKELNEQDKSCEKESLDNIGLDKIDDALNNDNSIDKKLSSDLILNIRSRIFKSNSLAISIILLFIILILTISLYVRKKRSN